MRERERERVLNVDEVETRSKKVLSKMMGRKEEEKEREMGKWRRRRVHQPQLQLG